MLLLLTASALFVAVLWLNKKWGRFRRLWDSLTSSLSGTFVIAAGAAALLLLVARFWVGDEPGGWLGGIAVEGFGFLFDIILFGIILYALEDRRERSKRIREYQHQLEDFLRWRGEEAVFRKVGIIKRLNELGGELPDLTGAYLKDAKLARAILKGEYMYGANLSGAELTMADLNSTIFAGADLTNCELSAADLTSAVLTYADINGAFLEHAENLTWEQVRNAANWDKAVGYPDNVIEEAKADGVDLTNLHPPESVEE